MSRQSPDRREDVEPDITQNQLEVTVDILPPREITQSRNVLHQVTVANRGAAGYFSALGWWTDLDGNPTEDAESRQWVYAWGRHTRGKAKNYLQNAKEGTVVLCLTHIGTNQVTAWPVEAGQGSEHRSHGAAPLLPPGRGLVLAITKEGTPDRHYAAYRFELGERLPEIVYDPALLHRALESWDAAS